MKIVLASAWYPVGVGAYLLRAARRLGVDVVTVGPTSGAQCWDPMFQYPAHAIRPDYPSILAFEIAHQAGAQKDIDLWVDIDGGHFTDTPGKMPFPHAIVATDPHISEQGEHWSYRRQREVADFFFCMQKPYLTTNPDLHQSRREFFLPYAYDPEVFHPYPDQEMDADVTVLGMPYPKRTAVAQELQRRGFRVLAGMGTVYEAYARDLCRAPVCFIWSLKDDVPCRVFEAAACGRAIVANMSIAKHVREILPDLKVRWFDDQRTDCSPELVAANHIHSFFAENLPTPGHTVTKKWVMGAGFVGSNYGTTSAVAGHTWDARLRQIVRTCLGREI